MIIDIHTHIIPFVDDGCRSFDDSVNMIKESSKLGVTHIIATPHQIPHRYYKSKDEIIHNFDLLKQRVKEENIPVNLFLGEEIHYSIHHISEKLKTGELLSLNNSNVILLEFSFNDMPYDLSEILYNFNCDGYKVIVAHIERYNWMNLDLATQIHNSGNYIQVNDASLIGINGFKKKFFSRMLLKHNLIDYVASDMHSFRPSRLSKALRLFKSKDLEPNKDIFGLQSNC